MPAHRLATLAILAAAAAFAANAQQIYRTVGPDGRVTFSDKPPLDAAPAKSGAAQAETLATRAGGIMSLPFELRQAASRFPVTLYTSGGCSSCAAGRAMLVARGIPFSEKTVNSKDDIDALQRLSGGNSVPLLTVGGQQLKGYSDTEWSQFLDAAGYPKTSHLPPSYTPAPATPLVAAQEPPAKPAPEAAQAAPAALQPPAPAGDNPAGIKF